MGEGRVRRGEAVRVCTLELRLACAGEAARARAGDDERANAGEHARAWAGEGARARGEPGGTTPSMLPRRGEAARAALLRVGEA